MKRLIIAAIAIATVPAPAAAPAVPADKPQRPHDLPKQLAAHKADVQRYLHLQRQTIETVEDPLVAGAIGISEIKEIAIEAQMLEPGVRALRRVAETSGRPVLRRLALLSLADLHVSAGKPAEAIEALADMCLSDDDDEDEHAVGGGCRCPYRRAGGKRGPDGREERERREHHERRAREERERMRRHVEAREQARRLRARAIEEKLEQRCRELDEKARQVERRMEELQRREQELQRREQREREERGKE